MCNIELKNEDCFVFMNNLQENSVDLIVTDPPYGITQNDWDTSISLKNMWKCFYRVLREDGTICVTASQPFSSLLISSNIKRFKCEWIWQKTIGSGQLNISHMPLQTHEHIIVFKNKKRGTYNPQMTEGEPYTINRKGSKFGNSYGKQKDVKVINDGRRHPKSIILVPNPRIKKQHPTQKPVELMSYFVKTYSNEGNIILDPFMGSGTTAISCVQNNRNFIGIEISKEYYEIAEERVGAEICSQKKEC